MPSEKTSRFPGDLVTDENGAPKKKTDGVT